MPKKFLTIILVTNLVALGLGVYGGMKYVQSKSSQDRSVGTNFQNFRNLSPEERQQRLQQMSLSEAGANGNRGALGSGGFASGEIIAKDDKSITVKLRDSRSANGQGGSKTIFYSDATKVAKFTDGSLSDLEIGKLVTVSGKVNSDGSITADSIQLRPQPQN